MHLVSHCPQSSLEESKSTQSVPQIVMAAGQTHCPPWHAKLPEHDTPHAPQLYESVFRSEHAPSARHITKPDAVHWPEQTPSLQYGAEGGHGTLHAPQLLLSVFVLTQLPRPPLRSLRSHCVSPPAHPHVPLVHGDTPAGHATPHEPQLLLSVSKFVHRFPHAVIPLTTSQDWAHVPSLHMPPRPGAPHCEKPHALPHAPQLYGSFVKLVHAAPHMESAGPHPHWPFVHCAPSGHAALHIPQFKTSV
jgi:hypothetical protein